MSGVDSSKEEPREPMSRAPVIDDEPIRESIGQRLSQTFQFIG